ncbi:hypothetical protein [Cutibacterium granulosum]|uniref:hypothetical protein n=1 Tax=Cutibacterium granulosum TaxID=33011 RepID=UPI002B2358C8|nr:hypothetical protein [Cutibacterium granulosum]MEA5642561.1 hypothetical protein [Cutibacterium granulosum]
MSSSYDSKDDLAAATPPDGSTTHRDGDRQPSSRETEVGGSQVEFGGAAADETAGRRHASGTLTNGDGEPRTIEESTSAEPTGTATARSTDPRSTVTGVPGRQEHHAETDRQEQVAAPRPGVWTRMRSLPEEHPGRAVMLCLGVAVIAGVVCALIWHACVHLPIYQVDDKGYATTSERGLTAIFSIDSTFALIGMVVGVGCGFLSWWALHHRGVVVLVPTIATALVSATVCWAVGTLMGPHDFSDRVAAASPGDEVPVDFRLHTWTSLLVWVLGALIVTLILAVIHTVGDQRSASTGQSDSHEVEQGHRGRSDEGSGQQGSDRDVTHPTT